MYIYVYRVRDRLYTNVYTYMPQLDSVFFNVYKQPSKAPLVNERTLLWLCT